MDTSPSTPPLASSVANPLADPVDEKLLKRARNAGRNLSVLAILATLGAMAFIAATLFAKGIHAPMAVMAGTITLVAAGYWVLATAARRGNPNAVGTVIVMMVLQICLSLICSGIVAARTNSEFQPPVGGVVIPVLVLVALASSRKVLLELKQRRLWDQVFGSAKPSGGLCLIGGTLLATGFVAMNAGTYYIAMIAIEHQKAEILHAKAFVELLRGDEKEFLSAMEMVTGNRSQNEIQSALGKLGNLEQHLGVLEKEAADTERLVQILTTYGNALRQWKNGLMLLKESNSEIDRVQKMLKLGDRFRAEACQDFDSRYAPRKRQPSR